MRKTLTVFVLMLILPLTLLATDPGGNHGILLTGSGAAAGQTYNFYVGTTAGGEDFTKPIDAACNPANTNPCLWQGGTAGTTYFFKATIVSSTGIEGPPSNEVNVVFPTVPPSPSLSGVPQ